MSLVTYDDVMLPYPFTTRFSQDPVYDEVAGVDWYCTKFDIQVQFIIHIEYIPSMSSDYANVTEENAATVMDLIRRRLMRPRRTLSFKCNGVELIPGKAGVLGKVDVKNGPQPQSCSILQLTSSSFLMSYHIIAHYWEKYDSKTSTSPNRAGNPVLYNRWTETVEIDNCLYTTRTREGKYIIRSDNVGGEKADQLRNQMAVIAVPEGFLRQTQRYTISPDGLGIQYYVVDKEVYKFPPNPAYTAQGQYTLSSSQGGVVTYGEVRLQLQGSKDATFCPQNKLIEAAMFVASTKLGIHGASMLLGASVTVDMYGNTVDVMMRALCNNYGARVKGVTLAKQFTERFCITPGSDTDDSTAPRYLSRGSAGLVLQAARYFNPDIRDNILVNDEGSGIQDVNIITPVSDVTQLKHGREIGEAGKQIER